MYVKIPTKVIRILNLARRIYLSFAIIDGKVKLGTTIVALI
jgi:hypothetical protein